MLFKKSISLLLFLLLIGLSIKANGETYTTLTKTNPAKQAPLKHPKSNNSKARELENKAYFQIQQYLNYQDYAGLKQAVTQGLNVNARSFSGDTSICTAVKLRRVYSFHLLQSLGADIAPDCMKKISKKEKQTFIRNFINNGGFISFADQDRMLEGGTNWKLVGGVAGGVALTGGIIALAAGGGGGGGSSGGDDTPTHKDKLPDSTNVDDYLTDEFSGATFTKYSNTQNFLGQINAQYAYAYATQNADITGAKTAGEGIIIGEMDTGIITNHKELFDNIATDENGKALGKNFQFGPCRNGDTTNCWSVNTKTMQATFYDSTSKTFSFSIDKDALESWYSYSSTFPDDWDWDQHIYEAVTYGDSSTHGTHVSGIMVARRDGEGMHGVAYNSKVIGTSLTMGWYDFNTSMQELYSYMIDNGAKAINNSWGSSGTEISDDINDNITAYNNLFKTSLTPALSYALTNNVISVFSAGNDRDSGYEYASITAAAPMANPSLLYYEDTDGSLKPFTSYPSDTSKIASSLFITVASVNADNELAYYSRKCGSAAQWCISAPGGEMYSNYSGGIISSVGDSVNSSGYEMYQGTSMAAPVVTSSLAVIMAAFPSLTPQEAVAVLFESATDLGTTGVDETYGHGLINLQAAMQPIGTTSLPTGSSLSNKVSFNNAKIVLPHSFSKKLSLPKNIMVVDKYNRGFAVQTNKLIRSTHHSKQAFANDLRLFSKGISRQSIQLSEKLNFNFSNNSSAFDPDSLSGKAFRMTYQNEDKISLSFSFSGDTKMTSSSYFEKGLKNPFTTSAQDVWSLENRFKLTENTAFSIFGSIGKNNFFDGNERLEEKNDDEQQTYGATLSWQPHSKFGIDFVSGILREESSVLGFSGYGAFETKNNDTYFTGIEVKANPLDKWYIGAGYYRGYSKGNTQNAFMNLSDLISESLGFNTAYQILPATTIGIHATSPLRITKGKMEINLPTGRATTENIVYHEKTKADLSSDAQEWDFGIYATKKTPYLTLQTEAMTRIHPENDADARADYRLLFSVGLNY